MKVRRTARVNAYTTDQIQGLAQLHDAGDIDDSQFSTGVKVLLALLARTRSQDQFAKETRRTKGAAEGS